MSVPLPTESPDREDSKNERKSYFRNQYFRQNTNEYSNSTDVVSSGYGDFLWRGQTRLYFPFLHALLDDGLFWHIQSSKNWARLNHPIKEGS